MASYRRHLLLLLPAVVLAGCAHKSPPQTTADRINDSRSFAELDAITPVPRLPRPTTEPNSRPPVEALELYAKARDAVMRGQPLLAVQLLKKAVVLDPYRFDVRYALGQAYLAVGGMDGNAIAAFESAADLNPDHLQVQIELGRLYLTAGDVGKALLHLRLATQTSDYPTDDGRAAVADYLLARALKQSGYDRAALDRFLIVLRRFADPLPSVPDNPELGFLLERPGTLYVQIGDLLERHGEYDQAVKAFEPAAEREPDNFDLHARIARDLARLGRRDEALHKAVDLIIKDHATAKSLNVLRDVCRELKIPGGEVAELQKLSKARPGDQAVLFALVDTLTAEKRSDEAINLLESAWKKSPGDVRLTHRLFLLSRQTDPAVELAHLLITSLSRNPDALHNLSPLWLKLFRTSQSHRMTLASAAALAVPPGEEPARQLLVALTAEDQDRPALARRALQQAVAIKPPFAPAFREMLRITWNRSELSEAQKIQICDQLVLEAKSAGAASLAEELNGRSLMAQHKSAEAAIAFNTALALDSRSPDLRFVIAESRRLSGHDVLYERALWDLTEDDPLYEDAYIALFRYYADPKISSIEQAGRVLSTWLANDPQSVLAELAQARLDMVLGQNRDAEQNLLRLFGEDPDDEAVYAAMRLFYEQIGRTDKLIAELEQTHTDRPRDTEIVARLVLLYAEQKRNTDAVRLLDSTRAAVAGDAESLYSLTSLYSDLDQQQESLDLLQQIVALDPGHAGACNDLGFEWADHGKNLAQAESLIRKAVLAEPDNAAFLDSLGWVLYKRGRFDEAKKYLDQAVGPSAFPDPVVLDHLGDTLYRLNKPDDAKQVWQRSLQGIGDQDTVRDDLKQLRLQLLQKIKAIEAKKPVPAS